MAAEGIIGAILGSEAVLLGVFIVVIGITFQGLLAYAKVGKEDFDIRLTGISMLVGFLVSLQLVMTALEHLPADASPTVYVTIVVGEILTVMGVDTGSKYVGKKLKLGSGGTKGGWDINKGSPPDRV